MCVLSVGRARAVWSYHTVFIWTMWDQTCARETGDWVICVCVLITAALQRTNTFTVIRQCRENWFMLHITAINMNNCVVNYCRLRVSSDVLVALGGERAARQHKSILKLCPVSCALPSVILCHKFL